MALDPIKAQAAHAAGRLAKIAMSDTGQARYARNFLLAWHNARTCGGFDFTDFWGVDTAIADDMLAVLRYVAHAREYPAALMIGDICVRLAEDRLASKECAS